MRLIARDRLPEADGREVETWAASGTGPVDWEYIYQRYAEPLRRLVARRIPHSGPIDDIVHETFVRAIRSTQLIDTSRPPWPFLATVAGRAVADWWQREGARPWAEQSTTAATEDFPGSDEHALALDRAVLARQALLALKPRHRRVLYLYEASDCSYEALTESEQISVQAMKSLLGRARGRFQARYRELLAGDAAFGVVMWVRTLSRRLRVRLHPAQVAMGMEGLLALGGAVVAGVMVGTSASPAASTSVARLSHAWANASVSLPAPERTAEATSARTETAARAGEATSFDGTMDVAPRPTSRSAASVDAGSAISNEPYSSTVSFWVTLENPLTRDTTTFGMETRCDQGEIAKQKCQVFRSLPGSR